MTKITLGAGHQNFVLTRAARNDTIVDFRSIYFGNNLSGAQEVPANNSDASGSFTAALNFDHTRFTFRLKLNGIDLDGDQTAASADNMSDMHIHGAPPGVSGPPIFAFRTDAETSLIAATGVVRGGWDASEDLSGDFLSDLLEGKTYFNIHTVQFSGGEIRGQILRVDQGLDRIDLRQLNIGSLATLREVTSDVQGDAVIRTIFNGEVSNLRLDGVSEAELRNAHFIFGGGGDQTVNGRALADDLFGGNGQDAIAGRGGNDRLWGEIGNDRLSGGIGNDEINGGAGDDTIQGQSGRDLINGGAGMDELSGGPGADRFDFNALSDSGKTAPTSDLILDFGNGDRIDLSTIDARPGGADQAFDFIGAAAFTAAGQARVTESATASFVAINTIGRGGAEMLIRVDGLGLAEGDFIL